MLDKQLELYRKLKDNIFSPEIPRCPFCDNDIIPRIDKVKKCDCGARYYGTALIDNDPEDIYEFIKKHDRITVKNTDLRIIHNYIIDIQKVDYSLDPLFDTVCVPEKGQYVLGHIICWREKQKIGRPKVHKSTKDRDTAYRARLKKYREIAIISIENMNRLPEDIQESIKKIGIPEI